MGTCISGTGQPRPVKLPKVGESLPVTTENYHVATGYKTFGISWVIFSGRFCLKCLSSAVFNWAKLTNKRDVIEFPLISLVNLSSKNWILRSPKKCQVWTLGSWEGRWEDVTARIFTSRGIVLYTGTCSKIATKIHSYSIILSVCAWK